MKSFSKWLWISIFYALWAGFTVDALVLIIKVCFTQGHDMDAIVSAIWYCILSAIFANGWQKAQEAKRTYV